MKLSKTGLVIAAIYGVLAISLVTYAFYALVDVKSRVMLIQLALLPAMLLAGAAGLTEFIVAHPWLNSLPVFGVLNLLIFYGIGHGLGALFSTPKPRTPPDP